MPPSGAGHLDAGDRRGPGLTDSGLRGMGALHGPRDWWGCAERRITISGSPGGASVCTDSYSTGPPHQTCRVRELAGMGDTRRSRRFVGVTRSAYRHRRSLRAPLVLTQFLGEDLGIREAFVVRAHRSRPSSERVVERTLKPLVPRLGGLMTRPPSRPDARAAAHPIHDRDFTAAAAMAVGGAVRAFCSPHDRTTGYQQTRRPRPHRPRAARHSRAADTLKKNASPPWG